MRPLVLVPCSASKRLAATPATLGHRLAGMSVADAAVAWKTGIAEAAPRVPVQELYKGTSWALSRQLAATCAEVGGAVAVVSAGLGLAKWNDLAPGYDITFSGRSEAVVPGGATPEGRAAWWTALGGPAAVLRALGDGQHDALIVGLPESYGDAVAPSIGAAAALVGDDNVTVLACSLSGFAREAMGSFWLRIEPGRLRALGGSVANSPLVAAQNIVRTLGGTGAISRQAVSEHLAKLPAPVQVYPRRERRGYEHAAAWIAARITGRNPPGSASEALSAYRDEGFAFEQKAFQAIFQKVSAEAVTARESE